MLATVPVGFPVGLVVQLVDADALAGGNVDEFSVSEIKSAVRCAFFIGAEKYKISGDKLLLSFDIFPELVLLIGGARKGVAVLLEDIL